MKLAAVGTTQADSRSAMIDLYRQVRETLGTRVDVVFCTCSADYAIDELQRAWREVAPGVRLHGTTSCQGAMTQAGLHSDGGRGIALLAVADPAGAFGVGLASQGSDARAAARHALEAALKDAGRDGELPSVVWLAAAPGREEEVILGLEDLLGPNVPILGGSSAAHDVSGGWSQFTHEARGDDAVVVATLFPSKRVAFSFHSGYDPRPHEGRVTSLSGRTVLEIDGRPAAEVYDEWTGLSVRDEIESEATITTTALDPLGRRIGALDGVDYFLLSQPVKVTGDRGLILFTQATVGDRLVAMRGSRQSLQRRAGWVARAARLAGGFAPDDVVGGLVIYCAGCMLTVRDELDAVVDSLNDELHGRPFVGSFTFGEQGCFPNGENRHGNMMIAVLLFGT